jgi:uncharacterized membrane protein YgcG
MGVRSVTVKGANQWPHMLVCQSVAIFFGQFEQVARFCQVSHKMAIVVPELEKATLIAQAGSDLKFLLDREGVDIELQVKLFFVGVSSVKQFSAFAEDKADLRKSLKTNFEVDPDTDIRSRVAIAKVLVAWDAARARAAKMAEAEGDAQARNVPKEVGSSDHHAMRKAFETKYWEVDDMKVPGKTYIEKKLDEVEKDELRAEPLTEVISQNDDDPDTLKTVWSVGGELKAVKVGSRVSLPTTPEALRQRITLLGTAWIFVASHQTNRVYLEGITPQLFQEYLDYLLGVHVHGLGASDAHGSSIGTPSWDLVISYEHAIRSKSIQLVRKGEVFRKALRMAWEDPVTKERNFTTPLALEAVTRRPSAGHAPSEPNRKYQRSHRADGKGSGKGKGSGGGKNSNHSGGKGAKGGKGGKSCSRMTPDGKNICYSFNEGGCTNKGCKFAHARRGRGLPR